MRSRPPLMSISVYSWLLSILLLCTLVLSSFIVVAPASAYDPARPIGTEAASVASSGNFFSAVPALTAPDQFAVATYADTMVVPDWSHAALLSAGSSSASELAKLSDVGAVYGLAYDDGSVSGVERILMGAFTRRFVHFGSGGPGAIYEYIINDETFPMRNGSIFTFATGSAGPLDIHGSDPGNYQRDDSGAAYWFGKTGYGDLEVSPDGQTLYAVNLRHRRIDTWDLASGAAGSISIPLSTYIPAGSYDHTDHLVPFALQFVPGANRDPALVIGVTDTAEGSHWWAAGSNQPDVYVLAYVPSTNTWNGLSLHQPLMSVPRNLAGGNSFPSDGENWYPWVRNPADFSKNFGNHFLHPMPLLTDIAFSRDGNFMTLGIRDITGDLTFHQSLTGQTTTIAQGDTLRYRFSGGAWVFQSGEAYDDNIDIGGGGDHLENHMGGLATALRGLTTDLRANQGYTEDLRITSLFGGSSSGLYTYHETGGDPTSSLTLDLPFPGYKGSKSSLLGDVEYLTSFALVGGRVWHDHHPGNPALSRDGLYQYGEALLANVTIQYVDEQGIVLGGATTDPRGVYLMAVPPNTRFTLRIAPYEFEPYQTLSNYRMTRQDVGEGSDPDQDPMNDSDANPVVRNIRFGAPAPPGTRRVLTRLRDSDTRSYSFGLTQELAHGELSGTVWNDLDQDSRLDQGEFKHQGVNVALQRDETRSGGRAANHRYPRLTSTNGEGLYEFRNIEPGIYRVVFTPLANHSGVDIAHDNHANPTSGWATSWFEVNENTLTRNAAMRGGYDLWITETGPAQAIRGDEFEYTVNYGNTGGTARYVEIKAHPDGVTIRRNGTNPDWSTNYAGGVKRWYIGDMAPGDTGSMTIQVDTSQFSPVNVQNVVTIRSTGAYAHEDNTDNNRAEVNTRLIDPDMRVVKSGPTSALVDDEIEYILTIENTGVGPARDAVLYDGLPHGLFYVSASPAPSSVSGRMIRWNLGDVPSGARSSFTVRARSVRWTPDTVINSSRITASNEPNARRSNNTSSWTTQILRPALSVVKSGPATATVGDGYGYLLRVRNSGNGEARNVVLTDVVPPELRIFSTNPAANQSGNTLTWNLGTVPAGYDQLFSVVVSSDIATLPFDPAAKHAVLTNNATVTTSTHDDPGDNSSSHSTTIQVPDMNIDLSTTSSAYPVGSRMTLQARIGNSGSAWGRNARVDITIPSGLTFDSARGGSGLYDSCSYNSGTRVVSCDIAHTSSGDFWTSSNYVYVRLNIPADLDFSVHSLDFSGTVTNDVPEHPSTLADNSDTHRIGVQRPNPYIEIDAPNAAVDGNTIGQGSYFAYTVTYGNDLANLGRPSGLTIDADNTELVVDLPSDVTFVNVDTGNQGRCSESGGTVTCAISSLPARTNNQQLLVIVQTNAPAGTDLPVEARISTTTPGDDTVDNRDTDSTTVVPPPDEVPEGTSDLTLAIHGDLDPLSEDGDPGNAVYWLDDIAFSWPTGEVLDFTPRLNGLSLQSVPSPYEYRAEVLGWSVVSFTLPDGTVVPATGTDSRGEAGCRGSGGPAQHDLTGCMYTYLGGDNLTQIQGSAPDPTELEMHDQARAYWTHPPAPSGMTTNAYVFTMPEIGPVQITVEVSVETRLVTPTVPTMIGGVPIPAMDFPIPPPRIQVFQGIFDMTPVVPRTIIGPGSVVPGEPVQPV